MQFVSLDIETTGIDPDTDQILEIAAVLGDLDPDTRIEDCPTFHCYVMHNRIVGSPFALAMNADILRIIAKPKDHPSATFLDADEVANAIREWLLGHLRKGKFTFAGKNFAGFDLQFLKRLPGWSQAGPFVHHRSFDIGSMYFNPEIDAEIPNLDTCIRRGGLEGEVTHRAMNEAVLVAKLVRKFYLG